MIGRDHTSGPRPYTIGYRNSEFGLDAELTLRQPRSYQLGYRNVWNTVFHTRIIAK